MPLPLVIVIAGPPGSGKTTYFPVTAFRIDSFNIDDRCAQILGSYRAIPRDVRSAVARECERFVLDHIGQGKSFAVETTLRTTVAIDQAKLARQQGFMTHLRFVATSASEENVKRVLQRAQSGGHAASERDICAIYQSSLANLPKALQAFDSARVYDSTERWAVPRLVAASHGGRVTRVGSVPAWIETLIQPE